VCGESTLGVCVNVYVSDWEISRESKTQRLRERGTHLSSIGLRDYGFSWGTAPGCERDGGRERRTERWRKGERDCGLAAATLMRDRPCVKKSPQCCDMCWFSKVWRKLPPFCIQRVWVFRYDISLSKYDWRFVYEVTPHVPVLLSFIISCQLKWLIRVEGISANIKQQWKKCTVWSECQLAY